MSEEQLPAARDTTFDGIKPEKMWLWLCFRNKKPNHLDVILELNGIQKVIRRFYIPGLDPNDGCLSESHNLTWILRGELEKGIIADLTSRVSFLEKCLNERNNVR